MMYCVGLCLMAILIYLSCAGGSQSDSSKTSSFTTKVVANVGSTVWLNCSAVAPQNDVHADITWFKYGKPLFEVTFRSMDNIMRFDGRVLVFDEVLLADAGRYMCITVTVNGIENRTFNLSVKEPREFPSILGRPQGNMSTIFGQTVVFSCKVQTRTITYIEWRFLQSVSLNTTNINDSSTYLSTKVLPIKLQLRVVVPLLVDSISRSRRTTFGEGQQIHEDLLYIYNVTYEASGTYVCLAFNKYGKTIKEITLMVSAEHTEASCAPNRSIVKPDSDIPMAILFTIPAGLFLLACTIVTRSVVKSHHEKKSPGTEKDNETGRLNVNENVIPKEKDVFVSKSSTTDINENKPVAMVAAQKFEPIHVIDAKIQPASADEQRFDSLSVSSASMVEIVLTDNKLVNHLNFSKQSSLPSSTEATYNSPTPELISSSSCGIELDWEGMDLTIPEGFDPVQLSREEEV